jgi:hypothetical protein
LKWLAEHPDRGVELKRWWRKEHKAEIREYYRNWYDTKGRKRARDYAEVIKSWDAANPEKRVARDALRVAIRSRKIVRPKLCQGCRKALRLHAHHRDYMRPLEVIWLCASCHKLEHTNRKTK